MILGILVGIIMRDWRGVLFASIAGGVTNLAFFFTMYRPDWVAQGTVTDDLGGYALVFFTGWGVCLISASIVFAIKRTLRAMSGRATDRASD